MNKSKPLTVIGIAIAALVIIVGAIFFVRGKSSAPAALNDANACVNQTLAVGASGRCVNDVQAMVNLMQSNKLIEACPFTGGKALESNGNFDVVTQEQVKVIQAWVNCYNKEEGLTDMLNVEGTVDKATWASLCTYGYNFPKRSNQSGSQYLQAGLAAGADAGCQ